MAKNQVENLEVYSDVIKALVQKAANGIEGIEVIDEKATAKEKKLRGYGISVYLMPNDKVTIDIFANILYGFNVPDVVASLQEVAIKEVEESTRYTVISINVQVVSVIFPPN